MIILLNASSSDQYNNGKYDFALVRIDTEEAKLLTRYFNLFDLAKKSEETFLEMTFQAVGVECEFYDYDVWEGEEDIDDTIPEPMRTELEENGYAIVPDDVELPFKSKDSHLPAALYLQMNEKVFWWQAIPQSYDLDITTESLPRELITPIVNGTCLAV
jgi:hypothetical protein